MVSRCRVVESMKRWGLTRPPKRTVNWHRGRETLSRVPVLQLGKPVLPGAQRKPVLSPPTAAALHPDSRSQEGRGLGHGS